MEIRKIIIQNIASLGEATVDFTQAPLADESLFLICGDTGAGKSTLIDAVCLALYGKVPRFESLHRESVEVGENELAVTNDARNLLRKGTAEGLAEVWFTGNQGVLYKAAWKVRRARGKASGKMQPAERILIKVERGQDQVMSSQVSVVDKEIPRVVGLSFEQFTRTVVLAQGQFARFLQANENEKAEILEMLTDTGIYSTISKRIFERRRREQEAFDAIEQRMGNVTLLSEDEVAALQEEQRQLAEAQQTLGIAARQLGAKQQWHQQRALLERAVEDLGKQEREATARWEEAAEDKANMDLWDALGDTRTQLQREAEAIRTLEAFQKAGSDDWPQTLRASGNQVLTSLVARWQQAHNEEADIAKKVSQSEAKIAQQQLLLPSLDAKVAECEKTFSEAEKALHLAREEEKQIDVTSLQAQRNDCVAKTRRLADLENARESFLQQEKTLQECQLRTKIVTEKQAKDQAALDKALQTYKEHTPAWEQAERDYNRAREWAAPALGTLRAQLQEGEACPVCGATSHPYACGARSLQEVADQLDQNLKRLKEALDLASAHKQRIKDEGTEARTALNLVTKDVAENRQKEEAQTAALAKARAKVTALSAPLFPDTAWDDLPLAITQAKAGLDQRLKEIEERIGDSIKRREVSDKAQKYWNTASVALHTAQQNRQAGWTNFENEQKERGYALETLKSKANQCKELREEMHREKERQALVLEESRRAVDQWLASWNTRGRLVTRETLWHLMALPLETVAALRERLQALQNQKTTVHSLLEAKRVEQQTHLELPQRPTPQETEEVLQAQDKELQTKLQAGNDRLVAVRSALQVQAANKERLGQWEEERKAQSLVLARWHFLNDAFGQADGGKLKKLAQSYTLHILLKYANVQLAQLTQQYQLMGSPNLLSISVVDRNMADEVRPVSTLSGGETFLVSLALALGLSSLNQERIPIGTLFIDEGFGTLDAPTLETVMTALENLHKQGRKVGIISHVPALKERIPTQIRVLKNQNSGSSRVEIV